MDVPYRGRWELHNQQNGDATESRTVLSGTGKEGKEEGMP